ncbi:hypothetical protein KSS87_019014 [Heliosperma pusillum]|nr:hypothetical protein KSS87_019014 [Heliosperma pusillum]
MGAYCNGDNVGLVSMRNSPIMSHDLTSSKHIHDNLHGNIYLEPLFLKFVDTEQFQRLRDLKQLGVANLVYPGAVHSRFEHSLGVYWLSAQAIHMLHNRHRMELDIDNFDIKTVKLAGLLHDVGHGPFSHLFEREFLPRVLDGAKWSHEQMSVKLIDHIVDEHHIDVDSSTMKRVKEMVLASSEFASPKSTREKHFLYDIVANGRNGVDVDKFDYIVRDSRACGLGCNFEFNRLMEQMRVIDNEICYPAKDYLSVYKLFSARADLYRTVYMHAKVKLDDSIIKTIETAPDEELKEAKDLIKRIRRRDLYQFCNEYAVPREDLEHFRNVTAQDIICSQKSGGVTLKEDDVIVSNVKIDLTRGRLNPLVQLPPLEYRLAWSMAVKLNDHLSQEKFPIRDDRISHLLPACYQDTIVRVYSKKPKLVDAISEAFENFQRKTYGTTTQVHGTPLKKRRM